MKKRFREIFLPKLPLAKKDKINYSLIDRFTFVHFMIGFCYELLGFGFGLVVLLAIAWEFLENPLKAHLPFIFPNGTADTLQNSVGDTLAVILGWTISFYVI